MNNPIVSLCADKETLAKAIASFQFTDSETGHIGSIRFGALTIQSYGDATVFDLADTLERLARDLRDVTLTTRIRDWTERHPEQPAPLDHGGTCEVCSKDASSLFAVAAPIDGGEHEVVKACASCAHVEHADELAVA